jgi:hypothetical protein
LDLHIEGATRLDASRRAIFNQLTDPHHLSDAMPGKEEARVLDGAKAGLPQRRWHWATPGWCFPPGATSDASRRVVLLLF